MASVEVFVAGRRYLRKTLWRSACQGLVNSAATGMTGLRTLW
jgi:hypothetical protein